MSIKAVLAFIIIGLNSAAVLGQYAEFSFDKKVKKFEPVKEGEILEHSFKFTNTGDTGGGGDNGEYV